MDNLTDYQLLKLYYAVMGADDDKDIEPLSQEEVDEIENEYDGRRIELTQTDRELLAGLRQEWVDTVTDEQLVEMGMRIVEKMIRDGYGRVERID